MKSVTSTELARNLSRLLDEIMREGEEIAIERNGQQIARLVPGSARQTAIQAMADLYRTLPDRAAAKWEADSRKGRWRGGRLARGIRETWLF